MVALALLAVPSLGAAQERRAAGRGAEHWLRLHPRAGDTLRMRFELEVRLQPLAAGGGPASAARPVTSMIVLSRAIVETGDDRGRVVTSVTDSVALWVANAPGEAVERSRRGMQGRQTRMRVAPDGSMEWLDVAAKRTLGEGGLPAALPMAPVPIGASWTRTMPLPGATAGGKAAPRLEVVFHLDSVVHGGQHAYLSMKGALASVGDAAPRLDGATVLGGTVSGMLVVDLARGWVVDSRTSFALELAAPTRAEAGQPPARSRMQRLRMLVQQRLRAR